MDKSGRLRTPATRKSFLNNYEEIDTTRNFFPNIEQADIFNQLLNELEPYIHKSMIHRRTIIESLFSEGRPRRRYLSERKLKSLTCRNVHYQKINMKRNCISYIMEIDELSNLFHPNDISADIESGVQETDEFDQLLNAFDPGDRKDSSRTSSTTMWDSSSVT